MSTGAREDNTDKHGRHQPMLQGRHSERAVLARLLEAAGSGRSGVIVLRGEAGIGKSALLDYAIGLVEGLRVVQAVGVESEMELPFATLHQLCAPMLEHIEAIPGPQREALSTALGLHAGPAPDRLLVGLAVLSLWSEIAEQSRLLCVLDDAQWADRGSAQALAFVARRMFAESVALVVATREPSDLFTGLPENVVEGLPDEDARALFASVVRGPVDERARDRFIAETRGNPLALLELPREVSAAELAVGFGLPPARPLSGWIEESFQRRLAALPKTTRLLVVTAAAEPLGDPALLWRAAENLGIRDTALDPARAAGLLEVDVRVRFRHPLVRSAAYQAASLSDRRRVHLALAQVTDADTDPDRRAWHRARAALRPDEDIAAELERSAERAQSRGGVAASAAFLQRSVELTDDSARRAQRALAAAQAKHLAGAPDAALGLLHLAEAGPLDDLGLARVDMLRAQVAYMQNRGSEVPTLLLRAAKRLEPLDGRLARASYLEALTAAFYLGRVARRDRLVEVAQAALAAPRPRRPNASDLLLDGLATRFVGGYARSTPMLKCALAAFPGEDITSDEALPWLWAAVQAAVILWDDGKWEWAAARWVQLARDTGVLAVLPVALNGRIAAHAFAGELTSAAALVEEVQAVTEATGNRVPPYGALILAAWRGREAEAAGLIDATTNEAQIRGEAYALSTAAWARALLYNGLGRYEDALAAAARASEHTEDLWFYNWGLAESILAAVRAGKRELAVTALERLSDITRASGSDWALGIEARSRALLKEDAVAEGLYREAIDRLGRTRVRTELARAHLLYGEWLRRERRRRDAREELRHAHTMFANMGIEAFAQRAERELVATGGRTRRRVPETRDDLTAQEAQVARLARNGLSNPEIGARLFISPRTVEYHLHKVFAKLRIGSRHQLADVLDSEEDSGSD